MSTGEPSPPNSIDNEPLPPIGTAEEPTEDELRTVFDKDAVSGPDLRVVYDRLLRTVEELGDRLKIDVEDEAFTRCLRAVERLATVRKEDVDYALGLVTSLAESAEQRISRLESRLPSNPRGHDAPEGSHDSAGPTIPTPRQTESLEDFSDRF